MEITIRTLQGQSIHMQVEPDQTVGDLKMLVQQKDWPSMAMPSTSSSSRPLNFHLFLKGTKLDATTPIRSFSLQTGDFLVLVPYAKKKQAIAFSEAANLKKQGCTIDEMSDCSQMRGIKPCQLESSFSASMLSGQQCACSQAANHTTDATEAVWNSIAADLAAWKASTYLPDDVTSEKADISEVHSSGNFYGLECITSSKNKRQELSTRGQYESNKKHRKQCGFEHSTDRDLDRNMTEHLVESAALLTDAGNTVDKADTHRESRENEDSSEDFMSTVVKHTGSQSYKKSTKSWLCPPVLERLNQVFTALNTVYGFLQQQHMQGTWKNMKEAIQQICGFEGGMVNADDIEKLAMLFPQLVHISCRDGEGNLASFSIDILDPSRITHHEVPRSLHEVVPIELQNGIVPSDLLPNTCGKRISDRVIRSTIQKREIAFQTAVDTLIKRLQDSSRCSMARLNSMTLDDIILTMKTFSKSSVEKHMEQGSIANLPRPPRQHKKLKRCMDTQDLIVHEMIQHLKKGLGSLGQMVHCEILIPREAIYGQLAVNISRPIEAAVKKLGILRLYSHQTEAINAAVSGQSVIVATSTASGKSVCYNIPVLEELFNNTESCALYLFPTKALAQDQLRALLRMTSGLDPTIDVGVYDGDTPQHHRLRFRDHARILITNPDMLHVSILPSHKQFERLLSNLRYVVIDEAHAYRGAFGCHTAVILRRLRRLCHHLYGIEPTFIVSSATVANPREHTMELIGLRDIHVVQDDGSPCGEKLFVLWNPPTYLSSLQTSSMLKGQYTSKVNNLSSAQMQQVQVKRSSPIVEVSSLQAEMVQHNLRCICFCKTRKLSELVLSFTREILKEIAPDLVNTVRAYRGGYTAQDRRNIEGDLFGGRLRAVAATNALELGVDVGNLDATLHLGFPGTITSLWQQAGRAGRREKPSLSLYVAFESPLDQYFMKNPHKLFSRCIEHAQIDAYNPQVLEQHLACAALEHPLHLQYDEDYFGSGLEENISELVKRGRLGRHPSRCSQNNSWHYIGQEKTPSQYVSIRAIDPEKYTVINQATNEVIEEVEESKAFFEVYEGAVYIHQGKTYLVKVLDLAAKIALCQEADVKYYTKTRDYTDVHVLGAELAYPRKTSNSKYPTTTAQASMCKVTTRWIGFRRIWQSTNKTFDSVDLFLPEYSYESQAAWIRVPHPIREDLDAKGVSFRAGLHAASHALLNVMPLYIMCNISDLGTECANPHDTRYFPERLLMFDRHPGGIGIATQARPLFAELLQAALELLVSCECTPDVGCPNCVQYLACSEYNEVIHKQAAIFVLQGVIQAEDSYRQSKPQN